MYNCELEPVARRYEIPESHAGIEATVRHMDRIATRSATSPAVLEAAADIVGSSSGAEAAGRIREYLATRMVFEFDPPGVELIRTPELLLNHIGCNGIASGDCDDVAVLGASLGLAAGLQPSYVLLAFHDAAPFEHVYTELETDTGPVELDTTRPAHLPPGLEIRRTERRVVAMYGNSCGGGNGLAGFWGDLWGGAKEAGAVVLSETVETWTEQQSTDPYGPGYVGGSYVSEPDPVFVEAGAPPMSPMITALVVGGIALAGLKIANVI